MIEKLASMAQQQNLIGRPEKWSYTLFLIRLGPGNEHFVRHQANIFEFFSSPTSWCLSTMFSYSFESALGPSHMSVVTVPRPFCSRYSRNRSGSLGYMKTHACADFVVGSRFHVPPMTCTRSLERYLLI